MCLGRGPGSEIRDPEKPIPDPGVIKAPDPGSGSATLVGTFQSAFKDNNYKTVDVKGFFAS
jgi:hypothetical protein